jgi:tetratricopeptide (TPR) repeat protein
MARPFVGRVDQLRTLRELFDSLALGKSAVAMIDGEPGQGKSALVAEFVAGARESGAFVLQGGCFEMIGGTIPYGPLIEALRQLVRDRGDAGARELAGPAWTELRGLIADFTGGGQAPVAMGDQRQVFGSMSRLFQHIGEHRPLVLVFEDVHWADDSTLNLIAYLAMSTVERRVLLLCTYRSGLDPKHALRARLADPQFVSRVHRLTVGPFTSPELRMFLSALTDTDVSTELVDRYFGLSEGNPYFTEQLVAADDLAGPAPPVPASIGELMLTRLGRLSADATRLARVAAVAGRRVSDALLSKIVDLDEAALDAALGECLQRRILVEDPVEETYSFQHALLRETVYRDVSLRERRRLHAALAEVLEGEVAENPSRLPELAYHWSSADRRPEALRTSVAAGDLAVRMRAFREAQAQYARALELWPRVPDAETVSGVSRLSVLRVAADAARWAGHIRTAVDWIQEAIRVADPAVRGELHERLGSYEWEAGRIGESVESYRTARRLLGEGPSGGVGSRVYAALATAEIKDGRFRDALPLARRAVEQADTKAELARARTSEGLALVYLGRYDEGVDGLRAALVAAQEAEHLEDLLRTYATLGVGLERANRLTEAVETFLRGLDTAQELGLAGTRNASVLANNAAALLFLVGRWDEADALLKEILQHHPAQEEVFQRLTKSDVDIARGDYRKAAALLESVRSYPHSQPRFVGPFYRCLAELALSAGEVEDSLVKIWRGIDVIERSEDAQETLQLCAFGLRVSADQKWQGRADALLDRARLAAAGNEDDPVAQALFALCEIEEARVRGVDATASWEALAERWRSLERLYPMAYALVRQTLALGREGDKETAAAVGGTAEALTTHLGALPLRDLLLKQTRKLRLKLKAAPAAEKHPFDLTQREWEVLNEAAKGLTQAEIGKRLVIATSTVGVHLHRIYGKLEVPSIAGAVVKARNLGLPEEK